MEPTIYKPGAYKSPGIYNGTGEIYNGRGVYNEGTDNIVNIGGRDYQFIKIGNLFWITENLDYKFPGVVIGTNASYYNNSESNYGIDGYYKCGLMYNRAAKDILVNNPEYLPTGWRIATSTDWNNLLSFAGTYANKIKSISNSIQSGFPSNSWGGTDEFGFNLSPCGDWENSYMYFNDRILLRCQDNSKFVCVYSNQTPVVSGHYDYLRMYLRLCKDV